MFALVLIGLDCAKVQVVIEWAVRVVHLAEPSRRGAIADQLDPERKTLTVPHYAKDQVVRQKVIEWAVRVVRLAEPSRRGAIADQLDPERKTLTVPGVLRES
jgi:hypothetical protein